MQVTALVALGGWCEQRGRTTPDRGGKGAGAGRLETHQHSNWEERLRVKSVKHLNIFIDILEGMPPRDIKHKYEIKTLNKKEALYKGYKKIRKTLGLSHNLSEAPLTGGDVDHRWWIEKAREALGVLEQEAS